MSAPITEASVDISDRAVDFALEHYGGEYAPLIRALRSALTAAATDCDDMQADYRRVKAERDALQASLTASGLASKTLAVLALQSERYTDDMDFRQAVDDVLALTKEVTL